MMAAAANKPHVLVAGAGITGLLIAQGLKKNGIECTVFEKEPSETHYRPREWGMSIQWGLPLAAECLPPELFERLYTASVDPAYQPEDPGILPTLNGKTGELLKNVPLVYMYRVSRRKFRALCSQGIKVEYGKSIKNVVYPDDKTVTAVFDDGSKATGTLLVGTDGAQSVVRQVLFGAEKSQTLTVPYTAINLHVQYRDAEKAAYLRKTHPIMTMGIHPDGYWVWISAQDIVDPNDPTTWVFQLLMTWKKTENEKPVTLEGLKEQAKLFGEPFRSAFEWLPSDTIINVNKMSYWVPVPWNTKDGRILLAGDAAHPMTFQRGQGMNHGIADAAKLTRVLTAAATATENGGDGGDAGNGHWAKAAAEYQAEMIDRAGAEVLMSKKNTEMLHDWDQMLKSPIMSKEAAYARERH